MSGDRRSEGRRRAVLLLMWALAGGMPAAGAEDTVDGAMAALDHEVAALRTIRDGLRKELDARPAPAEPALTVHLVFSGGMNLGRGGVMSVTLRRSGGVWIWGTGRPRTADRVDASGLTLRVEPGRRFVLKGPVRVRLALDYAGKPVFSENVEAVFVVDAGVTGEAIAGAYRTDGYRPVPEVPRFDYSSSDGNGSRVDQSPVPPGEGTVTGWMRQVRWESDVPVTPEEDIVNDTEDALIVKRAQARSVAACSLYRQIRACVQALRGGVDAAHAFELTPDYRPVWPMPSARGVQGIARSSAREAPRLEEVGDDLGLGLPDARPGVKTRSAAAGNAVTASRKEAMETVKAMVAHAGVLRRAAECARGGAGVGGSGAGDGGCADPDFGPWFGEDSLPREGARANVLPSRTDPVGLQEWRRVEGWRFLGPFPVFFSDLDVLDLPELIPAFGAGIVADRTLLQAEGDESPVVAGVARPPPDEVPDVEHTSAMAGLGMVTVPTGGGGTKNPNPALSCYGEAEVYSPDDREVWMGIQIRDAGALWINGRRVWRASAPVSLCHREIVERFRVRLSAGSNRLLLRVDSHGDGAWFALSVCTRGQPRTADEAARRRAAVDAAIAKATPVPDGIRGWRGDWRGIFADADPPLAWDIEKKINVRWEVPLGLSHAMPVIVGEKLLVLEDPATLTCLDKRSGAVLWRRECDIAELMAPDIKEKADRLRAEARVARDRLAALGATKEDRVKALIGEGLTEQAANEKVAELSRESGKDKSALRECGVFGPAWGDWTGHTFSTPVTDGRHVWFKSNTGIVACYDLDGNRRWMVRHDASTGTNAHVPSPVVVGGVLMLLLPVPNLESVKEHQRANSVLRGYDAESGRRLWEVDTAAGVRGEVTGTPLPMRLNNGREFLDVVVTPDGSVVRVEDGAILRMYLGTRECYGSPTWGGADRVVIFGGTRGQAFRSCYQLLMEDRDHVGARLLWHVVNPGTLYDSGNYQVASGGLIASYGARMDVADAETGLPLFRSGNILWRRPGRCYSPPSLAGGHLFVADLGNWFGMKKSAFHDGALSVVTMDRRPVVLARNRVGRTCSAPIFDGDRLYLRQWNSLLCLGRTGEAGRQFEAEVVGREVLSTLFPCRPDDSSPPVPVPSKGAGGGKASRLMPGHILGGLVLVTARDEAGAERLRVHLAGADLREMTETREATLATLAGVPCRLEPLRLRYTPEEAFGIRSHIVSKVGEGFTAEQERRAAAGAPGVWTERVIMGESGPPGSVIVLGGGFPANGTRTWLAAVAQNDRLQSLRFELSLDGARAWISGVEVRHNQRVELSAGLLQVLIELPVSAADGAERRLVPRFWSSRGAKEDVEDWLDAVERRRCYLEEVARMVPESGAGRAARGILASAGR